MQRSKGKSVNLCWWDYGCNWFGSEQGDVSKKYTQLTKTWAQLNINHLNQLQLLKMWDLKEKYY